MLFMRKPVVSGKFYPAEKAELIEEIKGFVKKNPNNKVIAGIVPHAGYTFSGKCAGKVYGLLPEAQTYVMAGTNHTGLGKEISISLEDFETPLGIVKNDMQLGKEILQELGLQEDSQAHKYEHSIEVQLPFLQQSQKDFKIVPIILADYNLEICKKLAKAIFKSSRKLKRKVILLASSDFTHSGPSYGAMIDMKIDKDAINKILKLDSKGFLDIANKTTICGAGAICTVIEFSKFKGAKKAELINYYDSSSVFPSADKVGYAGIILKKKESDLTRKEFKVLWQLEEGCNFPEEIETFLKMHVNDTKKIFQKLEKMGLIKITKKPDPRYNRENWYAVLDRDKAKEVYEEYKEWVQDL